MEVMRQDGIGEVKNGSGGAVSLCPLMRLIPSGSCVETKERKKKKKRKRRVLGQRDVKTVSNEKEWKRRA